MTDPDPMQTYVNLMDGVNWRMQLVKDLVQPPASGWDLQFRVEAAALQLRMAMEAVALASLSANEALYKRTHRDIAKLWNAEDILRRVDEVNPGFYPAPQWASLSNRPGIKFEISGTGTGHLTRHEFPRAYGRLSGLCHVSNPFAGGRDYARARAELSELRSKLMTLLRWHTVKLIGDSRIFLVRMKDPSGHVTSYPMTKESGIPDDGVSGDIRER